MKRLSAALFLFLFNFFPAFAQQTISGKITNADNGQAISGASVFISNTSKGTISNSTGDFLLVAPDGRHELIISFVGYETFSKTFSTEDLPLTMNIQLKLKVEELEGVSVIPFEKDGWTKWGKVFLDNFIGTSEDAASCKINNFESIRFRFYKKENKLSALSAEPLMIINKALGYRIDYQLESFEVDFEHGSLIYSGYPLFKEMKGSRKKKNKARMKAYNGSIMHFIHALYTKQLSEQGFDVKRLKKIPNVEKTRVKGMYKLVPKRKRNEKTGEVSTQMEYNYERFPKDSVAYFEEILRQKDYFDIYGNSLSTADSVTGITKNGKTYLAFPDYLYIVYKNEKEEMRYLQSTMENTRNPIYQRSLITLTGDKFVIIEPSGNHYSPMDLFSTGYWGWSEKIADLLPYDYEISN